MAPSRGWKGTGRPLTTIVIYDGHAEGERRCPALECVAILGLSPLCSGELPHFQEAPNTVILIDGVEAELWFASHRVGKPERQQPRKRKT